MKSVSTILGILALTLLCGSLTFWVLSPSEIVVNSFWGATALVSVAWAYVTRHALLVFLTRKSTRTGANISFVVLLVIATLVGVNFLAKQYSWRKDLTGSGLNSLSPQTLKVLKELPQDVKVYYFGSLSDRDKNEPVFRSYSHESARFQYEFVDTVRRPTFSQTMDVKKNDTTVFVLGGTNKKMKVEGVTEEKLTNGLIRLLKEKDQVVYFSTGHGERPPQGEGATLTYASIRSDLEKQGYAVKDLNLFNEGKIPADASVLVIAGPVQGFFPKELEILAAWIREGGRLLLAVDIAPTENGLAKGSRQAAELFKPYGIEVQNQMLVDPTSKAANVEPQILLGFSASKEHPITKDFPHSALAANFLFPLTTHLSAREIPELVVSSLVVTSQNAWAESDWVSLKSGVVKYDAGKDLKGEMSLGYAVESMKGKNPKPIRLVIFGTSSFAANGLVDKVGNRDLFLNSIAWLANDEQLISIRAKSEPESLKQINDGVLSLVLFVCVIVVPLLLLIIAVLVWLRRSKL